MWLKEEQGICLVHIKDTSKNIDGKQDGPREKEGWRRTDRLTEVHKRV